MFSSNITIRCLLLMILAWPGPRPVVHSHVDYLGQCGNNSQLAMHVHLYHGDQSSNPAVPCTPHYHWTTSGSEFDKIVPVKFTEGIAVADLEELPGDYLAADSLGTGLSPLTKMACTTDFNSLDQNVLSQFNLDLQQRFCKWTC